MEGVVPSSYHFPLDDAAPPWDVGRGSIPGRDQRHVAGCSGVVVEPLPCWYGMAWTSSLLGGSGSGAGQFLGAWNPGTLFSARATILLLYFPLFLPSFPLLFLLLPVLPWTLSYYTTHNVITEMTQKETNK